MGRQELVRWAWVQTSPSPIAADNRSNSTPTSRRTKVIVTRGSSLAPRNDPTNAAKVAAASSGSKAGSSNGPVPRWRAATPFNPTDQVVKFRGEARPGHTGLERFAQIAYGLARDGHVNKKGYPNKLAHVAVLMEMGDVRIPGLGFKLLAPVFGWVARRARKNGIEQELVNRYCT